MQENNELLELQRLRKERALQQFLQADTDLISANDAAVLIGDQVQYTPNGGLVGADQALANLRQTRPFLFRSSRADRGIVDQGVPPARPLSDEELATRLFGASNAYRGNSAACNRLALADKQEYIRLKAIAQRLGII